MKTIRKTGTKNTYFEGDFTLRDRTITNWAHPIDFPTVFTAFGAGIKSGNWKSYTSIFGYEYVIANYFEGQPANLKFIFELASILENTTWEQVDNDKDAVIALINEANEFLNELPKLK